MITKPTTAHIKPLVLKDEIKSCIKKPTPYLRRGWEKLL